MKWIPLRPKRILALDPSPRGFGFAFLEDDPLRLVNFGIKDCRTNMGLRLGKALKLISFYEPDLIVLEDWRMTRVARRETYRQFMIALEAELLDRELSYALYSPARVRTLFLPIGARTKTDVAKALSIRFPELLWRVPPPRKIYLPEDDQMSIFDALALGLTHLDETERRSSAMGP